MPLSGHPVTTPETETALRQLPVFATVQDLSRRGGLAAREGEEEMDGQERDPHAEEERRVFLWRLREFTRLGFAYRESVVLAGKGVDLAEARKLVACGCPAETASRILL